MGRKMPIFGEGMAIVEGTAADTARETMVGSTERKRSKMGYGHGLGCGAKSKSQCLVAAIVKEGMLVTKIIE